MTMQFDRKPTGEEAAQRMVAALKEAGIMRTEPLTPPPVFTRDRLSPIEVLKDLVRLYDNPRKPGLLETAQRHAAWQRAKQVLEMQEPLGSENRNLNKAD